MPSTLENRGFLQWERRKTEMWESELKWHACILWSMSRLLDGPGIPRLVAVFCSGARFSAWCQSIAPDLCKLEHLNNYLPLKDGSHIVPVGCDVKCITSVHMGVVDNGAQAADCRCYHIPLFKLFGSCHHFGDLHMSCVEYYTWNWWRQRWVSLWVTEDEVSKERLF